MIIKSNDFCNAGRLECMPGTVESEIFMLIPEEAWSVGPFTAEITKHIRLNHIRKAESVINKFLNPGHRFSDARFEAACKQVIFYDLCSPALVETILFERLDTLPLDQSTDIYGQRFLFRFPLPVSLKPG